MTRALLGAVGAAALTLGCAGHSAKTEDARRALDAGNPGQALVYMNERLDVEKAEELPKDVKGDNALLLLDRSMILQALENYQYSSRDMEIGDKQVEMLDFQRGALDDIGKYLFSDDVGPYKAPPYEKLLINTMNMVNYLARSDLNGARIEARRFSIMAKYMADQKHIAASMTAPGAYLAGFTFERSGRPDIALRYYDEALAIGEFPSLVGPVQRMAGASVPAFENIKKLLEKYPPPAPNATSGAGASAPDAAATGGGAGDATATSASGASAAASGSGGSGAGDASAPPISESESAAGNNPADAALPTELLVIVNYGRVPAKVAKRIPIGLALTFGALYLSSGASAQANELAAQGLVTWVNYPDLEETQRTYTTPGVKVDGSYRMLEGALAVDVETRRAYDKDKGAIIASAITRLIARVAVGQAARAAASDDTVGLLLSLGTQAALTAADTPDTRSWSMLPGRIAIARIPLTPGTHTVEITAQGATKHATVKLEPGGWDVLALTALR